MAGAGAGEGLVVAGPPTDAGCGSGSTSEVKHWPHQVASWVTSALQLGQRRCSSPAERRSVSPTGGGYRAPGGEPRRSDPTASRSQLAN